MVLKLISRLFFPNLAKDQLAVYEAQVEKINALEAEVQALSDEDLQAKTPAFKSRLAQGESLDALLPEAFAVVREASQRVLKMRHFDVQLIGGIVMHEGKISEMKTGEGKTLMSTLPAYLNALSGKGVFIVTVNDYLAERDAAWNGQLFEFLGVSVGLIKADMPPEERTKSYQADITYGTNNEFGFDYLRDNLAWEAEHLCQSNFNYAIIDEVDSILIDEARTPLIISGPVKDSVGKYKKISKYIKTLKKDEDFTLDEKHKNVVLTEDGVDKLEAEMKLPNLYSVENMDTAHMAVQCLKALYLFKKDIDYVVKNKEVAIVDEFTGRIMEGRRYSDGLHQAIEAIENVSIREESQTLASVTFQNYFRMFDKLAGMTGTAITEASEFESIYRLPVVQIPTNRPMVRDDQADLVYKSRQEKYKAIVKTVKEANQAGQPILLGTISIETSEFLSDLLKQAKVPHFVLNAKQHKKEAEIIANAGQKGAVTIATNMAGRGTDIVLGEGVKDLGGLKVLGAARHESRRIDNQLRGRSGRQGDPGASRFFVSLEDDLMRLFGSERIAKVMQTLGMPEDMPIEHKMITRSIEKAQSKVEKYHFSVRKQILEYDDVMNKQRETIYSLRRRILCKKDLDVVVQDYIVDCVDYLFSQYIETEDDAVKNVQLQFEQLFAMKGLEAAVAAGCQQLEKRAELGQHLFELYLQRKANPHPDVYEEIVTKRTLLSTLDRKWMDHLHHMDLLREGIGLRAWGQKDPLVEYKKEAFDLFTELLLSCAEEAISMIFRAVLLESDGQQSVTPALNELNYNKTESANQPVIASASEKVGRNDKVRLRSQTGEERDVKWKFAEPYLKEGWVRI
eukprot:COSAG01_NODE_71_length_28648_cov_1587.432449_20_plen_850_part_00